MIDDLIQARGGKVGELHFDDGPHALQGGADGRADHGILADRGIENAAGEFEGEILGGFESAAEGADILAVNEDAGVVGQGAGLGGANGFKVGNAHNVLVTG